jgi:hypothetical protein
MSEGNGKKLVVLALLIVVAALLGSFSEFDGAASVFNFAW